MALFKAREISFPYSASYLVLHCTKRFFLNLQVSPNISPFEEFLSPWPFTDKHCPMLRPKVSESRPLARTSGPVAGVRVTFRPIAAPADAEASGVDSCANVCSRDGETTLFVCKMGHLQRCLGRGYVSLRVWFEETMDIGTHCLQSSQLTQTAYPACLPSVKTTHLACWAWFVENCLV